MNETVEDGVRERGVWNSAVPVDRRDLSDNHGGRATIAVIQDFEQVSGLGAGKGVTEPVIKDEQMDAGQGAQ